jgi:hypothetical protein
MNGHKTVPTVPAPESKNDFDLMTFFKEDGHKRGLAKWVKPVLLTPDLMIAGYEVTSASPIQCCLAAFNLKTKTATDLDLMIAGYEVISAKIIECRLAAFNLKTQTVTDLDFRFRAQTDILNHRVRQAMSIVKLQKPENHFAVLYQDLDTITCVKTFKHDNETVQCVQTLELPTAWGDISDYLSTVTAHQDGIIFFNFDDNCLNRVNCFASDSRPEQISPGSDYRSNMPYQMAMLNHNTIAVAQKTGAQAAVILYDTESKQQSQTMPLYSFNYDLRIAVSPNCQAMLKYDETMSSFIFLNVDCADKISPLKFVTLIRVSGAIHQLRWYDDHHLLVNEQLSNDNCPQLAMYEFKRDSDKNPVFTRLGVLDTFVISPTILVCGYQVVAFSHQYHGCMFREYFSPEKQQALAEKIYAALNKSILPETICRIIAGYTLFCSPINNNKNNQQPTQATAPSQRGNHAA